MLHAGLGLSHATRVPEVEIDAKGGPAGTLPYGTIEAELGRKDATRSIFTRLHHRSNGYGLFVDAVGSDVIVWGLRHRW